MRSTALLLTVFASMLFVACGGDDPADAGSGDAGAELDAGEVLDAGPPDAGPPDAGPPDAGTDSGAPDGGPPDAGTDAGPPTAAELAMEMTITRTALDTAVSDVPMSMRLDGAFADLDIAAGGLDALIGEDGLETLALSDATVRALADVHAANLVLDSLDSAITTLTGRSEVAAVLTVTMELRALTLAYRDTLIGIYRARLDLGILGSPIVVESFTTNSKLIANGALSRQLVVIEGLSAVAAEANLSVECFPSDGVVNFDIEVRLVETGTSLAMMSGTDSAAFTVAVPFDEVSAVEVLFEGVSTGTLGFLETCNLSVTSRRQLRRAAEDVPITDTDYEFAFGTYSSSIAFIANELVVIEGSSDASVIAALQQAHTLIRDLVSMQDVSDRLPLPVEHFQRLSRQVVYVRAMIDALLASPPIGGVSFDMVRTEFGLAMTAVEDMLAVTGAL